MLFRASAVAEGWDMPQLSEDMDLALDCLMRVGRIAF